MLPNPADYEIIDVHTHPFLDYKNGCIGPYGKPLDMAEFDFEMKKAGLNRYAGAPLVVHKVINYQEIRKLNEDALRIRDRFPDYIPGIQVHEAFPQESIADLTKLYHEEGVRYIGELVPYIMDTGEFNSPGMLEILKEAGKLGMTVNFHGGCRKTVVPVLENCPGLNVILAHPRGMFTSFYQAQKIAVTLLYKFKTVDLSCFYTEEKILSKWQKTAI